jgi:Flp pilus assembly protein protease CpaA
MKPCIGKIPIAKILVVINAVSFLGLTNLVDNIIFNVVSLLVLLVTMIYLWIKK